jgi:hypothetical protein
LDSALKDTYAKINKYLNRGNLMPNRHNIISALMELLNLYQKELKIGEVITALHNHEIETAVPLHEHTLNNEQPKQAKALNPEVTRLCKELIGIMSPFAPDMSKTLLQSFIVSEK